MKFVIDDVLINFADMISTKTIVFNNESSNSLLVEDELKSI